MFVHDLVDLLDCQGAVDLLHRFAGVVHGQEGFLVDVGGLDGVDLVLEHRYLGRCLFEGVLVGFFAFHRCSGSCF